MEKYIQVNTPTGQYIFPLEPVAKNRADYYACEVDGHEKGSMEWIAEVNYVMEDDYEGIDWLLNNSNWEDWQEIATKVNSKVNVTDDDFWTSSDDFEIIEK